MSEVLAVLYSFVRVGVLGFGGGPAMVPLIQIETVGLRGWLSNEEFLDVLAFGNALPGPIATKLAGYIGYEVAGVAGAVAGLLGITAPTIVAMVALFGIYLRLRHLPVVQDFLSGVRPVVLALVALVAWQFLPSAFPGGLAQAWPLVLMAGVALWLSLRSRLHPALLIPAGGLLGLLLFRG